MAEFIGLVGGSRDAGYKSLEESIYTPPIYVLDTLTTAQEICE